MCQCMHSDTCVSACVSDTCVSHAWCVSACVSVVYGDTCSGACVSVQSRMVVVCQCTGVWCGV